MKPRILFAIAAIFLFGNTALAEPHYTALFGQGCHLCHVNPSGKGMRALYGSQFFAPNYLPVKPIDFEKLEKIKPQLSESVMIGCDLRTIWMSENTQDNSESGLSAPLSTNTGKISQMEGNLYLTLQPSEEFFAYFSQGVRGENDGGTGGRTELFGVADVLPWNGYMKAGQFQENYGWAFADHTSFVRTGLWQGYDGDWYSSPTPPHYGVGAEMGFRPMFLDVSGSFMNGQSYFPDPSDRQKRWTVRAQAQRGIEKLKLQFTGGGSWMHAPPLFSSSTRMEAWGGFAGIGWEGMAGKLGCDEGFGFLATSLLFEYDRKSWSPFAQPPALTSAYSTTQLSTMVQQGVWLVGQYDWLEMGDNLGTEAERTSIGLQVFPLPWVDLQPRYRLYSSSHADRLKNTQHWEMLVHFAF